MACFACCTASFIFLYSLLSHRLERTILTGPMIFTAAGILLYFALPDQLARPLELRPTLRLAEVALAMETNLDAMDDLLGQALKRLQEMGTLGNRGVLAPA